MRRDPQHRDRGESLVEVVMTMVILMSGVTGIIAALATASAASTSHRASVVADATMRNYAESFAKAAASCTAGAALVPTFTPPSGFTATSSPTGLTCPATTATTVVTLSVRGPSGAVDSMQIRVRTP
ncbi:MAG: hypothetical protein RJA49_1146 [Actinomycetota bacterium]